MAATIEIIWETPDSVLIDGVERKLIIRDVPQKWHGRIKEYMLEHFFKTNRLYEKLNWFEIPETEEHFVLLVQHVLRDECSVMVIDEETNEIFGVALVKWMTKKWRSWTILDLIVPRDIYAEFSSMGREKVLEYAELNPNHPFDSLHLFEFTLHKDLKVCEHFLHKFFSAICGVARHMGMPRVTYLARTQEEQALAEAAGWTELDRIIYSLYLVRGQRPFSRLRDLDEMYAILYEQPLVRLTPFYYMLPPMPYDAEDELKHQPPRPMIIQPSTFTLTAGVSHGVLQA